MGEVTGTLRWLSPLWVILLSVRRPRRPGHYPQTARHFRRRIDAIAFAKRKGIRLERR